MKTKCKTFNWQGIDINGQRTRGELVAANKKTAATILKQRSLSAIKLHQQLQMPTLLSLKISSKHITDFTLQLANLLIAGIPLIKSLTIIIEETNNKFYQKLLLDIQKQVENGHSLSTALNAYKKYFDQAFIGLVQAGEHSGQLENCLSIIAEFRIKHAEFKEKLLKALIYPLSVILTAIIISAGLIFFAIPQLKNIFTDFGLQLPYLTKLIINFSDLLRQQSSIILICIIFSVTIIALIYRLSQNFKLFLQAIVFKIPILSSILLRKYIILWSSIMTTTLSAGLPLLSSLRIAQNSIKNSYFISKIQSMQRTVIQGQALHEAMAQIKIFPRRIKSMICTAEQTGNLHRMLKTITELEMKALDQQLDHLTKLLEPLIMLVLAIIAGAMIFAFYLPIFHIGKTL